MVRWLGLFAVGAVTVGVLFGAMVVVGWMVDETRFDRPDADFDRLTLRIGELPGVSVQDQERWVEAPTFSDPRSWIELAVDAPHLPGLLAALCQTRYPDTVSWSFRIRADAETVVSVHTDTTSSIEASGSPCPDVGFDVEGLVDEVAHVVPGIDLQPTIWNDHFALVALEDDPGGLETVLPLVAHADDLRNAAGLSPDRSVEINAGSLGVIIESDEHDRYLALLSDLVKEQGVTAFWADGGGTQADGVEKVQIIAPEKEHAAIAHRIRDSGLHIADLPVRFIPLDAPTSSGE